jgi:kumamolisin
MSSPGQNVDLVRDLEILGSIAPGAKLAVYFAPNTEQGMVDGIGAAIHDRARQPSVICVTRGVNEKSVSRQVAMAVGKHLDAAVLLGRTVCAPAWAWDGREVRPQFPGSHPLVLACGATIARQEGQKLVERPAGRGGSSTLWPRPAWQSRLIRRAAGRVLPDVCALGDEHIGYRCYINGRWVSIGGPGAATCIWAGLFARLGQALGRTWGMVSDLYKSRSLSLTELSAWDRSLGWGCPNGIAMLTALQSVGGEER